MVIHSPFSGRSAQLSEALGYLKQASIEIVSVLAISSLDGLPPQGRIWQEQGIDIAVAAGGDGLVGGVITHITQNDLLLGILPLGTANDIARSLALPQDLRQAAAVLASGKVITIDIGVAHPAEQALHLAGVGEGEHAFSSTPTQKHGYFAHALTVGFNVHFAQLATNIATRQRYGNLTYPLTALEVLRNHNALDMQFSFTGLALPSNPPNTSSPIISQEPATLQCRTLLAAVINAPIFGGALQLSIPGSQMNDRLLDIVIIEEIEPEHLNALIEHLFNPDVQPDPRQLAKATILQKAERLHLPGFHYVQAQGVVITTSSDPQDATLDGEIRGRTPIYARTADERIRVLVPLIMD
jgi:diacylglycerol kinase family enzyme